MTKPRTISVKELLKREKLVSYADMRQFDRIDLTQGQYIAVDLVKPKMDSLEIRNISSGGVGLARISSDEWPAEGTELNGKLQSIEKEVSIKIKIIRIGEEIVGCQFLDISDDLRRFIVRQYEIEISALKIARIRPEILTAYRDGRPWWLKTRNGDEIYVQERVDEIARFYVYVDNLYIEGSHFGDLRYSTIPIGAFEQKGKKSVLAHVASPIPQKEADKAIRLINSLGNIPSRFRDTLNDVLTRRC